MTLEQFATEVQADIERFAKRWTKANAIDPDNWPLEADCVEWYENFDILSCRFQKFDDSA